LIADPETRFPFPQIYFLVDEYDSFNNGYLEPNNATSRGTAVEETFKSFWSRVKELAGPTKGIPRAFITGISPLALSDIVSGFNIATNRSFDKDLAGLCGLTSTDIKAALKEACGSDLDAYQNHLSAMTEFFNGYHFCDQEKVETMYNTDTCLAYLQVRNFARLFQFLITMGIIGHHQRKESKSSTP